MGHSREVFGAIEGFFQAQVLFLPPTNGVAKVVFSVVSIRQLFSPLEGGGRRPDMFKLVTEKTFS